MSSRRIGGFRLAEALRWPTSGLSLGLAGLGLILLLQLAAPGDRRWSGHCRGLPSAPGCMDRAAAARAVAVAQSQLAEADAMIVALSARMPAPGSPDAAVLERLRAQLPSLRAGLDQALAAWDAASAERTAGLEQEPFAWPKRPPGLLHIVQDQTGRGPASEPAPPESAPAPTDPCEAERDWAEAERGVPGILLRLAEEALAACEARGRSPGPDPRRSSRFVN